MARQLALMHALVRFAHVAAGNNFTTTEIHPYVIKALGCAPERYLTLMLSGVIALMEERLLQR
jgi:hypothetical protein